MKKRSGCRVYLSVLSSQLLPHFYLKIHFPPNGITSQLITLTNRISGIFFVFFLFFLPLGFSVDRARRMVKKKCWTKTSGEIKLQSFVWDGRFRQDRGKKRFGNNCRHFKSLFLMNFRIRLPNGNTMRT